MRIDLGKTFQRVLRFLHLSPLSLAAKCRFMFGAAVLFSLLLALLIPYVWMRQLTRKVLLDTNSARAESVLFRSHFRLGSSGGIKLPELNEQGGARDPNAPGILWVRLQKEQETADLSRLNDGQKELLERIVADGVRDEGLRLARVDGSLESDYVRLFRATEGCMSCHNPQGSAVPFPLNEPVGAAVVHTRGVGGELRRMIFMNRIWTLMAGVIGATGAMVAFYWIMQRVILRPIRQLRALANNVAEGNLDVRSSISTGDEYERLADAFDHMLDNLQASQEKLRQANRQLDAKIAELSERNIELFKANKLKSEFLANMSHEFRTPLNAILGFAQVLREKPGLLKREKGQRYAENIITSGNRLLTMINDLLDLAKTQAGKLELHIEQASVVQVCESLVSSFSLLARKKRIRISMDVSPEVPLITTDAGKVQQVLYNFLSNAVKFTPIRGQIEIRAHMLDDRMLRIAVRDTGCGIAKADRDKIFDKFKQGDGSGSPTCGAAALGGVRVEPDAQPGRAAAPRAGASPRPPSNRGQDARDTGGWATEGPSWVRESSGSGLGLAISKELAAMLAGAIGFESEVEVGSTFWLDLPITLAPEKKPSVRSPSVARG